MTVINTNVSALYAQAAITSNTRSMQQTMQQLSTGNRINSAADDAAGLSISARLTSQVRGLNQAIRNANDAISMLQTAEGATDTITNMLQRMRELTIQAGNDTNGTDDKAALASEFVALATEIDRVAKATTWNGATVLDGGAPGTVPSGSIVKKSFSFVVDASATATGTISVDLNTMVTGATVASGKGIEVATAGASAAAGTLKSDTNAAGATALVVIVDASIKYVNSMRSTLGAVINRLEYTVDNLTNISTNTAASRSRIQDVDYSTASSDLAKRNIVQQAATAMLAQANQQPQAILQLLK